MTKRCWTITKDYKADPEAKPGTNANAVGIVGPHDAAYSHEEIVGHDQAIPFRMLDDDHEVYYEGRMVGCDDFQPLDDFGTPNAGCTILQTFEGGRWVTV